MTQPSQSGPPFVLALAGVSNLRDLGGYRAADGRRVRRGLVFRSAALAGLTEADKAFVGQPWTPHRSATSAAWRKA